MGCDDTGTSTALPVQGCVDISTGFDVNAGANANFFGLFDAGTQLTLFNKTFDLFSVSFVRHGAQTTSTDLTRPSALLQCVLELELAQARAG